jgi:hypothetical protein
MCLLHDRRNTAGGAIYILCTLAADDLVRAIREPGSVGATLVVDA